VDVIEIDGASNNSVDDVRDLRERVKYVPSSGKFKAYIIDEAHMLSTAAFNALLKTLEEPPAHVIFILATTEARKIPLTVMSRCQHLPFRRVSSLSIRERLRLIADSEHIGATDDALALVARAADGSIRDSLTILDQVASFTDNITDADVKDLLDVADFGSLAGIASAVIEGNREALVKAVADLVEHGTDLRAFTRDLIGIFRDLLILKLVSSAEGMLDLSGEELGYLRTLADHVSDEHLTLVISELVKAEGDVRGSYSPRVALEMALLRISYLSTFRTVSEAIAALPGIARSAGIAYAPAAEQAHAALPAPPETRLATPEKAEPEPLRTATVPEPTRAAEIVPEPIVQRAPEPAEAAEPVAAEPTAHQADAPEEPVDAGYTEGPPQPGYMDDETPYTADALVKGIMEMIGDPRVVSKLAAATPDLEGNILHLTFDNADAGICARPFKENPREVEALAAKLMQMPVTIKVHVKKAKAAARGTLKKKAMEEPIVREALDLFDGRIVNIKKPNE
jgi:DNA polymerase-3 subunit gamma/tau